MARIAGVDLPKKKRIEYGLTYIYGIGLTTSRKILNKVGISLDKRVHELSEDEIAAIRNEIQNNYQVEGDLRKKSGYGYQSSDGSWKLQRSQTQKRAASTWSENKNKCKNQKRS